MKVWIKHPVKLAALVSSYKKELSLVVFILFTALCCKAQLNPSQTMYFQNKYQVNPAMAGFEKGLNLNMGYRQQWSNFPGTPKTSIFTADFQPADKVGFGINVNDDKLGLIRTTRVMGTYAYHLPLSNNNDKLNFGISLGVNDARVDYNSIIGDVSDAEVSQFDQLKPYIDGDLGIAYTSDQLYIGGTLPNLKSAFFKSSDQRFDADRLLFIFSVNYKINMRADDKSFTLEPMAAYRVVKGYKDITDIGFNFKMNNYGIYLQSIYHTSDNIGLGFGLDQGVYNLSFSYNLETGLLSNYTQGAFEFGLKLNLFEK